MRKMLLVALYCLHAPLVAMEDAAQESDDTVHDSRSSHEFNTDKIREELAAIIAAQRPRITPPPASFSQPRPQGPYHPPGYVRTSSPLRDGSLSSARRSFCEDIFADPPSDNDDSSSTTPLRPSSLDVHRLNLQNLTSLEELPDSDNDAAMAQSGQSGTHPHTTYDQPPTAQTAWADARSESDSSPTTGCCCLRTKTKK